MGSGRGGRSAARCRRNGGDCGVSYWAGLKSWLQGLTFAHAISGLSVGVGLFVAGYAVGSDAGAGSNEKKLELARIEIDSLRASHDETYANLQAQHAKKLDERSLEFDEARERQSRLHDQYVSDIVERHKAEKDDIERSHRLELDQATEIARSEQNRDCNNQLRIEKALAQTLAIVQIQSGICPTPPQYAPILRQAEQQVSPELVTAARAQLPNGATRLPDFGCVATGQPFRLEEKKSVRHCETGMMISNASTLSGQISVRVDSGDRTRVRIGESIRLGASTCQLHLFSTNGTTHADLQIGC
ncbi:MAG: hypothetical protein AAF408_09545 [Pseudomonadota bacterium]